MPIGDDSVFSVADAALWSAFAAAGTRATALRDWRKEQNPGGQSSGKDFSAGEVPQLSELKTTDCPALLALDRGSLGPDELGPDVEWIAYPKAIFGVLARSRAEGSVSKKVKKFAALVQAVLVEQRAVAFNGLVASPNPIRRFEIGAIEFPQFEQPDTVAAFGMTVVFVLDMPVS